MLARQSPSVPLELRVVTTTLTRPATRSSAISLLGRTRTFDRNERPRSCRCSVDDAWDRASGRRLCWLARGYPARRADSSDVSVTASPVGESRRRRLPRSAARAAVASPSRRYLLVTVLFGILAVAATWPYAR